MSRAIFRLLIGLLFGVFGLVGYCTSSSENQITGEKQRVQLTPKEEVALGLQSREQMAAQFGGLYPDNALQDYVDQVGQRVVQQSAASSSTYPFEFHLLRDIETINAFALPGGQIFITAGLLRRLKSEAQLAGVLSHEVSHVIARHGAEHLAKQQLGSTLVAAVGVATTDEYGRGRQGAAVAQVVNQLATLKYGRADELESDRLGVRFMTEAGYDPRAMVDVMEVLRSAKSGNTSPEFLSTHPHSESRLEQLDNIIAQEYPNGVPANLREGRDEFSRVVIPRLSGRY